MEQVPSRPRTSTPGRPDQRGHGCAAPRSPRRARAPTASPGLSRPSRCEDDPPRAPHPVGAHVLALGHEFQQDPAGLLLPGAGPGQIPAVEARQPAERHRHRDESLKRWAHRGDQHSRRPKILHWEAAHVHDSAQRVLPGDTAHVNPGHALVADVDAREPRGRVRPPTGELHVRIGDPLGDAVDGERALTAEHDALPDLLVHHRDPRQCHVLPPFPQRDRARIAQSGTPAQPDARGVPAHRAPVVTGQDPQVLPCVAHSASVLRPQEAPQEGLSRRAGQDRSPTSWASGPPSPTGAKGWARGRATPSRAV